MSATNDKYIQPVSAEPPFRVTVIFENPLVGLGYGRIADSGRGIKWRNSTAPHEDSPLKREYAALTRLDHPNIPHAYAYGHATLTTTGDERTIIEYVTRDHVEGQPLTCLHEGGNLTASLDQIVAHFLGIVDVTRVVHDAQLVHGDIKPSNIIVGDRICLIDFDATVPVGTHGQVYTPEYAAPEQLSRRELCPKTDVYGIAASLYTSTTGRTIRTRDKDRFYLLHAMRDIDVSAVPEPVQRVVREGLMPVREDRPTLPELRAMLLQI